MTDSERRPFAWLAVALRSSAANLSLPMTSLLTGPLLARTLGPDGRGAMAALLAPISLINLALTLGGPEAMTYFVARGRLDRRRAILAALGAALVCGAAAILILAPSSHWILRHYPSLRTEYYLLLLTLPLTLGFATVRGAVNGLRRFDVVNIERASGAVIRLAALVSAASLGLLTASSAAWITVLSALVGSLALIPAFLKGPFNPSGNADLADFSRYAGRSALGTTGTFAVFKLDQTLMVPLAGSSQLGFYAVAVSLAELPVFAVNAIQDIVFAVAAEADDREVPARISRISTLVMIPVCTIAGLAAPFALPLLFGDAFRPAVVMTEILLAGTVPLTVTALLGAGLLSQGRAGTRSLVQIAGGVLTVVLVVLLVPPFGGVGAAIASLATYSGLALATAIAYSRTTSLPLRRCLVPTRADLDDVRSGARRIAGRRSGR